MFMVSPVASPRIVEPTPPRCSDDKGILRHITVNDLPVGRNVDEVLRVVKAFQYTDVHGEVCPAGWTPGAATMKGDTVGSKSYFASGATEGACSPCWCNRRSTALWLPGLCMPFGRALQSGQSAVPLAICKRALTPFALLCLCGLCSPCSDQVR